MLPFENLSDEKENAYFADGVQDEILTDLAKVADLKVISRTSVMQYKNGVNRNLREIGAALGVAHVLEGTVQRSGGRVRVKCPVNRCENGQRSFGRNVTIAMLPMCLRIESELAGTNRCSTSSQNLSERKKAAIEQKPTG